MSNYKRIRETLDYFVDAQTDVFLYAGPIEKSGYDALCDLLENKADKRKKVLLFLVTGGGNPNAGYRIARALCHHYGAQNFGVAIPAECKSAGTLICIGASSLLFFDRGELGPLDIQFQKQDEIFEQSSGLDILRGMTYLRKEALNTFSQYLIDINGGSGLSTVTASDIASQLVVGLFEPMFAQIDPARLGEMHAALQIADEYGSRLHEQAKSLKSDALSRLIYNYPTHGFVIDRSEARKIFERVVSPNDFEKILSALILDVFSARESRLEPCVEDVLVFIENLISKRGCSNGESTTSGGETAVDASQAGGAGSTDGDPEQIVGVEQPVVEGVENNG